MTNYHLPTDQAKVLKSAIRSFLRSSGAFIAPASPAWEAFIRPLAKALVNCEIADQQQINLRTLADGQLLSEYSKQALRKLYAKRAKLYRRT